MVRLKEHKELTESKAIERFPAPARVYIPLSQHLGKSCQPLVKLQDQVFLGQKIASAEAHVFSPIHASVSGKVVGLQDWPHPLLGRSPAIVIENDGTDNRPSSFVPRPSKSVEELSPEEMRSIIFEAGIVGMGGASFPTQIKLNPPKPVDTLIVNGAECEPYLTCDCRLMLEKSAEILKGIGLVVKCLGVKNVYIAIEDNKPEAIRLFESAVHGTPYAVRVLKTQYPQGGEKQLIKKVLGREVPSGKLPFDIGVVVHNVGTLLAIYEAVYLNKPLYERAVTVTGSILSNPKNLLVRIGTPISALIDYCGPLKEAAGKVIVGGPMMGLAQYSLDVPVIKSTSGIVVLSRKEAVKPIEEFCIRCGACVRDCPAGLMPCMISLASSAGNWALAQEYNVADCIECGICAYVCPAKRDMVQQMKHAKFMLAKTK
ncbi:MAG: electron transport complex subunit RsxC [Candidatus Omnitrophica bacterium]|nr:electron transport complex subunit RsxC [Candidatus Omnitrophota bacterium]MDD5512671.1 electron transport complex subunit RsxC [Candidatus Omnitrophota bacterium]